MRNRLFLFSLAAVVVAAAAIMFSAGAFERALSEAASGEAIGSVEVACGDRDSATGPSCRLASLPADGPRGLSSGDDDQRLALADTGDAIDGGSVSTLLGRDSQAVERPLLGGTEILIEIGAGQDRAIDLIGQGELNVLENASAFDDVNFGGE